jgi:hypothetical protein
MIIKSKSAGFDPITAGVHHAVCQSIIDLGTQEPFNKSFEPQRKVMFTWELPHEVKNFDGVNKPLTISRELSVSLNKKSSLRKMLDSWRGRPFTEGELKNGFDLSKLIGSNCQLNVVHVTGKADTSKVYANIEGVIPLGKGVASIAPFTAPLYWDLPEDGNANVPSQVPTWIASKVYKSREFLAYKKSADPEGDAGDSGEGAPF